MSFGAQTDHFGLASADLVLVESSETDIAQSRADARDEFGDIAATTYYGNSTQDMREIECTYVLKSGTLNINTIKLGSVAPTLTTIRESIEVSTSNSEFPMITVSGRKNCVAPIAPPLKSNAYSIPSVTITAAKIAQNMMFTISSGKLNSSSLEASIDIAQQENGAGEPIAHGLSGGTGTVSAEMVRISSALAWAIDTTGNTTFGPTIVQDPRHEEGQAAYHTGTGEIQFTLTRDSA